MQLEPSAFVADPELIQALEKRALCVTHNAESVLFRQGEAPSGLYVLFGGSVTLSMTASSGEHVTSVNAPEGSLLGLPGLIGNEPYTLTATAHPGARLAFVPRGEFTELMQTNPLLSLKVLRVLAAEVRSARRALANR